MRIAGWLRLKLKTNYITFFIFAIKAVETIKPLR